MLSVAVHVLLGEAEVNEPYLMHRERTLTCVANQNVIQLQVIVREASIMNALEYLKETHGKLEYCLNTEALFVLAEDDLQVLAVPRHHVVREHFLALMEQLEVHLVATLVDAINAHILAVEGVGGLGGGLGAGLGSVPFRTADHEEALMQDNWHAVRRVHAAIHASGQLHLTQYGYFATKHAMV